MEIRKVILPCQCKSATHAFCNRCGTVRPVAFEKATASTKRRLDTLGLQGGNLCCEACGNVVASLFRQLSQETAREVTPLRLVRAPKPRH